MDTLNFSDFHPEMNLFDALEPESFKKILGIAERFNADAGTTLIREGRQADAMYIVLNGRVKVFKQGDGEEQIELAILGSGAVFGEMGVFTGEAGSASVLAIEDSILLELPRKKLFQFLQENADIGLPLMHALVYILSNRLRKANAHAASVASSGAKLADTLQNMLN